MFLKSRTKTILLSGASLGTCVVIQVYCCALATSSMKIRDIVVQPVYASAFTWPLLQFPTQIRDPHSHFFLVNVIAVSFNVTVTVKVFASCCCHIVRAMQFYQESYTQCHWMWNTNDCSCCTCHRKQSKGYQRSRHGEPFVYNSSWTDSSAARKTERVTCWLLSK